MLDTSHLPTASNADVWQFTGQQYSSSLANDDVHTWVKPRGKTMAHILLVGKGGNGGTGVVGANSTAAGGGGGGSGAQTAITIPIRFLPDILYIGFGGFSSGRAFVSIAPPSAFASGPAANEVLMHAGNGGIGGNASGATAGAAGTGGTVATAALMPIGWAWATQVVAGQAGIIGGTTGAGAALTLPLTGLRVTGGTGGAGLPAAAAVGLAGGTFTTPTSLVFPAHPGGVGGSATTTPPGLGRMGYQVLPMGYWYGGTGGGSTHGSATGAGLVQASGGDGGLGCGGGGMGGALTGSTAGTVALGGSGFCIITCW